MFLALLIACFSITLRSWWTTTFASVYSALDVEKSITPIGIFACCTAVFRLAEQTILYLITIEPSPVK